VGGELTEFAAGILKCRTAELAVQPFECYEGQFDIRIEQYVSVYWNGRNVNCRQLQSKRRPAPTRTTGAEQATGSWYTL
jgi:hypothetical protein